MSQENVAVVRKGIEALNRRDVPAARALWRSDAEIDWSRSKGPLKGCLSGSCRDREFPERVLVDV